MRPLAIFGGTRSGSTRDSGRVTLRIGSSEDTDALARLAALDSTRMPPGPMLLAEVGDQLRAAVSLTDGTVLADPFCSTNEAVKLLRERAKELGC